MVKSKSYFVDLLWSDDHLFSKGSAVSLTCDALERDRVFTSGSGRHIEISRVTRVSNGPEVVDKLKELWGVEGEDGFRIWLADIAFPEDPVAGLKHLEDVLINSSVSTDGVVVVSRKIAEIQAELEQIGVRNQLNTRFYTTAGKPLVSDVRAFVGRIVDSRLE